MIWGEFLKLLPVQTRYSLMSDEKSFGLHLGPIGSIDQLCENTPYDLSLRKKFGPKSLKAVRWELQKIGRSLKDDKVLV